MNLETSKNKNDIDTSCNTSEAGYWQDVEAKVQNPENLGNEFPKDEFDSFTVEKSRRSFLKIMGFSVSALPLASCIRVPVKKALPYLLKNDTIVPGVANWFATKYDGCVSGCQVLIKTREGRPIKVEGNKLSKHSKGAACSACQGSVMELYDSARLKTPLFNGAISNWKSFDQKFIESLNLSKSSGKETVIITPSQKSPSTWALINDFKKHYGNISHIAYDSVSNAGISTAARETYGHEAIPELNLTNAEVVVSFGADFLSTWGDSTAYTKQYSSKRDLTLSNTMLKHIHLEPNMSLTGSNADVRHSVSSSEMDQVLLAVYGILTGNKTVTLSGKTIEVAAQIAKELSANRGRSLVIAGSNNRDVQIVVNKINGFLGNIDSTVSVFKSEYTTLANDKDFYTLINDVNSGKRNIGTVIFMGVNPAYDYFDQKAFTTFMSKVPSKVALVTSNNETSAQCGLVAASNHSYESWNDTLVTSKEVALTQPVMQALYGTRMASETLLAAMGSTSSFYDYMKNFWKTNFFKKQNSFATADGFWNKTLHDGVTFLEGISSSLVLNSASANDSINRLKMIKNTGVSVVAYTKLAIGNGRNANNPWLQELPDPITKATWDNYLQVSAAYAKNNSVKTGDMLTLSVGNTSITLPALVQAGTKDNTVAVALGYGRTVVGKVGKDVGSNAFGLVTYENETFSYSNAGATIKKESAMPAHEIALTQTHHSMEGRDIVRETTFENFLENPKSGNEHHAHIVTMWPKHDTSKGPKWGMVVDLNKCTGCSGCIVSCNAENNIPVVGKEEVHNRREMHWMRLDRYYIGDEENPEVVHQPMTCQHCDNAPCETVCPVLATVQSSDGLNQQVYNRCVGTRYCANNCPYKVRRFNWFDYPHEEANENMVLNPDVVVRTRGVMEKCSMCIQRIQAGKLVAKKEGRALVDNDIELACQQSCPADAIVFGDVNNPKSRINKYLKNTRNYKVLEELNVQPAVSYLTKVRNK